MSNTGTRFFGMPLEQLVRSNRVGGSLSSLGHTENWFRLLHRRGAARVLFFASSCPVAAALVAAALRWPEPRLSLIREPHNQKRSWGGIRSDYSLSGIQKSLVFR